MWGAITLAEPPECHFEENTEPLSHNMFCFGSLNRETALCGDAGSVVRKCKVLSAAVGAELRLALVRLV